MQPTLKGWPCRLQLALAKYLVDKYNSGLLLLLISILLLVYNSHYSQVPALAKYLVDKYDSGLLLLLISILLLVYNTHYSQLPLTQEILIYRPCLMLSSPVLI